MRGGDARSTVLSHACASAATPRRASSSSTPRTRSGDLSDLDLTIAGGTKDYISMVEAGAHEISEEDMLAALEFGQKAIGEFCDERAALPRQVHHHAARMAHPHPIRPSPSA
jgi:polyribonucleotide nucleotidyltransferase